MNALRWQLSVGKCRSLKGSAASLRGGGRLKLAEQGGSRSQNARFRTPLGALGGASQESEEGEVNTCGELFTSSSKTSGEWGIVGVWGLGGGAGYLAVKFREEVFLTPHFTPEASAVSVSVS